MNKLTTNYKWATYYNNYICIYTILGQERVSFFRNVMIIHICVIPVFSIILIFDDKKAAKLIYKITMH